MKFVAGQLVRRSGGEWGSCWDNTANAVIEAYKNHQQALKEYNEN